jgi:hypothetical protein
MAQYEGNHYWTAMMTAAINETPSPTGDRWPRGRERRHFRGKQGINAMSDLEYRYKTHPEYMVENIIEAAPDYKVLTDQVQTHRGFGPWIGFKVADMIDRCLGIHVDFTEAAVFMFDDPVKAALMVWLDYHKLPPGSKPKDRKAAIGEVVQHLAIAFEDFKAPPLYDRLVDLQEVETVLCKWKSHMNGHYPLNNDIIEIREGLEPWTAHSELAAEFLKGMPSST